MAKASLNDRLFDLRWQRSEPDLLEPFRLLYGERPEVEVQLKKMLRGHWDARADDLKDLDLQRDIAPDCSSRKKWWAMFFMSTGLRAR